MTRPSAVQDVWPNETQHPVHWRRDSPAPHRILTRGNSQLHQRPKKPVIDTPSARDKRRQNGIQSRKKLGHAQYSEAVTAKLLMCIIGAPSRVGSEAAELAV